MAYFVDNPDTRMTIRRLIKRPKYRYMVVNRIVPHLPWIALMALAAFTYKARIFAGSGIYCAEFMNAENFHIADQRIVAVIPQLLPLLATWMGLDMKYILLLFSLSHVLLVYFLFLLVYYGLRDRRSGLLIILSQTVGIAAGFFNPAFELFYSVPLIITFYSIWQLPFRFRTIWVLLILEVLILLSHPLAFVLFIYPLAYNFDPKTAKPLKYYLAIGLVFILAATFRYFMIQGNALEQLIIFLDHTQSKTITEILYPANYASAALFMLQHNTEIVLAFLIVLLMLFRKKQWIRLALVFISFMVSLVLVNSAFPFAAMVDKEILFYFFTPLVFIPLVYGFPLIGKPGLLNISILMVSALIAYRLAVIYFTSEAFMKRAVQMEQLIDVARQKGGGKFIASSKLIDHGYSELNGSYPVETLILSALEGNDISVTIVPTDENISAGKMLPTRLNRFLFTEQDSRDDNWLNAKYFHLDMGPYRSLNDTTPNKNLGIVSQNLRIDIVSKKIYKAADTVWITVNITNTSGQPVFSGYRNNVFLSYFWVLKNDVLNWNEIRTPLQADLIRTLQQDIKVVVPRNKGNMQLKVDIIADGNWLGIYSQADVLVY